MVFFIPKSRLCIMGRMKVYGQHWDLPEASYVENPFKKFLKTVDEEPEHRREKIQPAVDDHGRVEPDDQASRINVPDLQPVLDACTS